MSMVWLVRVESEEGSKILGAYSMLTKAFGQALAYMEKHGVGEWCADLSRTGSPLWYQGNEKCWVEGVCIH